PVETNFDVVGVDKHLLRFADESAATLEIGHLYRNEVFALLKYTGMNLVNPFSAVIVGRPYLHTINICLVGIVDLPQAKRRFATRCTREVNFTAEPHNSIGIANLCSRPVLRNVHCFPTSDFSVRVKPTLRNTFVISQRIYVFLLVFSVLRCSLFELFQLQIAVFRLLLSPVPADPGLYARSTPRRV